MDFFSDNVTIEIDKELNAAEAKIEKEREERRLQQEAKKASRKKKTEETSIVDKIIGHRRTKGGEVEFHVAWEGYSDNPDDGETTYELRKAFEDESIVDEYVAKHDDLMMKQNKNEKKKNENEKNGNDFIEVDLETKNAKTGEVQQKQDENVVLQRVEETAARRVIAGVAAILADHKEVISPSEIVDEMMSDEKRRIIASVMKVRENNPEKFDPDEVVEQLMKDKKKALPVKQVTQLSKALAVMANAAHAAAPPAPVREVMPKDAANKSEIDKAAVSDEKKVDDNNDEAGHDDGLQPDSGFDGMDTNDGLHADTGFDSYVPPIPVMNIQGLGKDDSELRPELIAIIEELIDIEVPNQYDSNKPPADVFDFYCYSAAKSHSMVAMAPPHVQKGHSYALYGWEDIGIRGKIEGASHMWSQKCTRLASDGSHTELKGWVWGQFDLCLFNNKLWIVLLCLHDSTIQGHFANMQLVLLRANVKMIRDEDARLRQCTAATRLSFNKNCIVSVPVVKCSAVTNAKMQPFVISKAVYDIASPFCEVYWKFIVAHHHGISQADKKVVDEETEEEDLKEGRKKSSRKPVKIERWSPVEETSKGTKKIKSTASDSSGDDRSRSNMKKGIKRKEEGKKKGKEGKNKAAKSNLPTSTDPSSWKKPEMQAFLKLHGMNVTGTKERLVSDCKAILANKKPGHPSEKQSPPTLASDLNSAAALIHSVNKTMAEIRKNMGALDDNTMPANNGQVQYPVQNYPNNSPYMFQPPYMNQYPPQQFFNSQQQYYNHPQQSPQQQAPYQQAPPHQQQQYYYNNNPFNSPQQQTPQQFLNISVPGQYAQPQFYPAQQHQQHQPHQPLGNMGGEKGGEEGGFYV